jgi:hypothetical protein
MSGSAGLASARRRRAGPSQTQSNQVQNSPNKENTVEQKVDTNAMSPMNPLALLVKHNEMIKMLSQDVAQLKEQVANLSLKVKPEPNNKEHIDYFKQQYNSLLDEMKETKKTLLKIQTFSMETNIEVMKLKRTPLEPEIVENKVYEEN